MLINPFNAWYTDTMVIYRAQNYLDGDTTRQYRARVSGAPIPCRIFNSGTTYTKMTTTDASVEPFDRLACTVDVDIQDGDEVIVTRGARVGGTKSQRYFAGDPTVYYEPYGGVSPQIAHQEVPISGEQRLWK